MMRCDEPAAIPNHFFIDGTFSKMKQASPQVTLYGIRNCDTMKKARAWLDQHGIEYRFHDYKVEGIDEKSLQRWCKHFGWEKVLNRAGTTFKKLAEKDRENLDERKAIALMLAQPSMIKRPVLEIVGRSGNKLIGFKPDEYRKAMESS